MPVCSTVEGPSILASFIICDFQHVVRLLLFYGPFQKDVSAEHRRNIAWAAYSQRWWCYAMCRLELKWQSCCLLAAGSPDAPCVFPFSPKLIRLQFVWTGPPCHAFLSQHHRPRECSSGSLADGFRSITQSDSWSSFCQMIHVHYKWFRPAIPYFLIAVTASILIHFFHLFVIFKHKIRVLKDKPNHANQNTTYNPTEVVDCVQCFFFYLMPYMLWRSRFHMLKKYLSNP